jgi:hypothetical protein
MHIVFAILAILGGASFWWWRMRDIGQAANDAGDVAGRLWGNYKRKKFLGKVNDSPLQVIDDPATAAVILMHVIQNEDGLTGPDADESLLREVTQTMGIKDPTEMITFGKWTANHASDANNVIMRYGQLWSEKLSIEEREDFVRMIERVSGQSTNGMLSPDKKARITRLRQRIGLRV